MASTSCCYGTHAQITCSSPSRTSEAAWRSSSSSPGPTRSMHSVTRTPTALATCSQSSPEAQHDQQSHHTSIGALPNQRVSPKRHRGAGGNRGDTWAPRGSADGACAVAAGAAPPSPRGATAGCIRRSLIRGDRRLASSSSASGRAKCELMLCVITPPRARSRQARSASASATMDAEASCGGPDVRATARRPIAVGSDLRWRLGRWGEGAPEALRAIAASMSAENGDHRRPAGGRHCGA